MNKTIMYLAVDEDGSFCLYREMPYRDKDHWQGIYTQCIGFNYPDDGELCLEYIPESLRGMTWEDEPVKVECEISVHIIK